jgi:hypothetical protein
MKAPLPETLLCKVNSSPQSQNTCNEYPYTSHQYITSFVIIERREAKRKRGRKSKENQTL